MLKHIAFLFLEFLSPFVLFDRMSVPILILMIEQVSGFSNRLIDFDPFHGLPASRLNP